MGDSDGDDGSSFGSIETVTDSEQEANAAALLTAAARDLSWTFLPGGDFTWFAKATRGSGNSLAGGRETTFCRSLIFECSSSIGDGKREKTKRRWRWGRCGLRLVSPKNRCRLHTLSDKNKIWSDVLASVFSHIEGPLSLQGNPVEGKYFVSSDEV